MINLSVIEPFWITKDPNIDQCAHGYIDFQINGTHFITKEDRNFTLSATGLFLLRTLELDHTSDSPVSSAAQLFADDGFSVWPSDNELGGIIIFGSAAGKDVWVKHEGDNVAIQGAKGKTEVVSSQEWRQAVKSFTDQVQEFYDAWPAKTPPDDKLDIDGWDLFWKEWHRRRIAL
jgi:hypothetical protein